MFGKFCFVLLFAVSNGLFLNDKSKLHCIFSKYLLNYFELNESCFAPHRQHEARSMYDHSALRYYAENLQKQGIIVMAMLDELRNQNYSKFPADLMTVNLYLNSITGSVAQYSVDPGQKGTAELEDDDSRISLELCNAYKTMTDELKSFLYRECKQKFCLAKIDPRFDNLRFRSKHRKEIEQSGKPQKMYNHLNRMVDAAKKGLEINILRKTYEDFHPSNMILLKLMNPPRADDQLDWLRYAKIKTSHGDVYVVHLFEKIKWSFNGHFLKSYQQQVIAASIYPVFSCTSSYVRMFKQLHLTDNGRTNKTRLSALGSQIGQIYRKIIHISFLPFKAAKYVFDISTKLQEISTFYEKEPHFLNVEWLNRFLSLLSKPMELNRFHYNSTNEILDSITEKECNVLIKNTEEEIQVAEQYTEALLENITPLLILQKSVNHEDMFQTEPLDIFNMPTVGTVYCDKFGVAGEVSSTTPNRPSHRATDMETDRRIGLTSALSSDEAMSNKKTSIVKRNPKTSGSSNSSKYQRSQSLPEKNKNGTSAGNQRKRVTLRDLLASIDSPISSHSSCRDKPLSGEQSDRVGEMILKDESTFISDEPGDEEKAPISVKQLRGSYEQLIEDRLKLNEACKCRRKNKNNNAKEEGTQSKEIHSSDQPTGIKDMQVEKDGVLQEAPISVKQLRGSYEQLIEDRLKLNEACNCQRKNKNNNAKEEGTQSKEIHSSDQPTGIEDMKTETDGVLQEAPISVKQLRGSYEQLIEDRLKLNEVCKCRRKNKNNNAKEEGTQSKEIHSSDRPTGIKDMKIETDGVLQDAPITVKKLRGSYEQIIKDRSEKNKSKIVESREKLTARKKSDVDHTRETEKSYKSNDIERQLRRSSIDWENLPRPLPRTDTKKVSTSQEKLKKSMDLNNNRSLQSTKTLSSECPLTIPAKKDNDHHIPNVKSNHRLQKQQPEAYDRHGGTDLLENNKKPERDTGGCDQHGENALHKHNNLFNTLKKPFIRKQAGDSTSLHCLFSEYILMYLKLNEKYFILKYGQSDVATYTAENLNNYESNLRSLTEYVLAMLDELRNYEKNMYAFDLMTVNLYLNNLTSDLNIFSTEITTTQTNSAEYRRNGLVANYRMMTKQLDSFTKSNCHSYSPDGFETRFGDLHQLVRHMDTVVDASTVPKTLLADLHTLKLGGFNSLKPTMDKGSHDDFHPANMLFFDLMSGYVKRDDSEKAQFATGPRSLTDMFKNRQRGDSAKFDDGLHAIREVVVSTSRRGGSNNSIIDAFYCVSLNFNSNYVKSFQQQVLAAAIHPVFDCIAKYTIAFKQVLFVYKYTAQYVQHITEIGSTLLNAFEQFIHLNLFSDNITKYLAELLDRLETVIHSQTKKSIKIGQLQLRLR